jgi:hypothetical protein
MNLRPANVHVHWQAPTVILLSYTASLAFAIGHHVFYTSLDQLSVDENLFNQQTNIAIGTAFAFLFRANLVLATCTAYWQVFWATALRQRQDFLPQSWTRGTGSAGMDSALCVAFASCHFICSTGNDDK